MTSRLFLALILAVAVLSATATAYPVYSPDDLTSAMIIDYSSLPGGGSLTPGSAVTDQYSPWGVLHDGHTATPPGPPGMSSRSGLPGLEAGAAGPGVPPLILRITFSDAFSGMREVGAFYLMGGAEDTITLSAYGNDEELIEAVTVIPDDMPHRPGPFGFNEGFLGLITDCPIAAVEFKSAEVTFVIDDLHFVPEPTSLALLAVAGLLTTKLRRTRVV